MLLLLISLHNVLFTTWVCRLPEPLDASEAEAFISNGVLIVVLPVKKPGQGKKLAVRELLKNEAPKPEASKQ